MLPHDYEVVAFDPGGTTGWAVTSVHREAMEDDEYKILDNILFWTAGEFTGPWESQVDAMLELCGAWPEAKVVCEDFYLRQLAVDLAPVRITGAFQYGLRLDGRKHKNAKARPIIMQMPALAMTTVTDAR